MIKILKLILLIFFIQDVNAQSEFSFPEETNDIKLEVFLEDEWLDTLLFNQRVLINKELGLEMFVFIGDFSSKKTGEDTITYLFKQIIKGKEMFYNPLFKSTSELIYDFNTNKFRLFNYYPESMDGYISYWSYNDKNIFSIIIIPFNKKFSFEEFENIFLNLKIITRTNRT